MQRILAVDDEQPILLALQDYFDARSFQVDCASNVEQARSFLEGTHYDLVITDLKLDGGGQEGFEVARLARGRHPETGTILLTARGSPEVEDEAKRHGVDVVLAKPQPLKEVARVAIALLEKRRVSCGAGTPPPEGSRASRAPTEALYRTLVETSLDAVSLLGRDGEFAYVSPSATRLLGYDAEELIGRNGFELIHPEDLSRARGRFADILAAPAQPLRLELRCRHKDGRWIHLEASASNRLADPAIGAIVASFRDVCDRKFAEKERESAQALLSAVAEATGDVIYAKGLDGRYRFANGAAARVAHRSVEDLIGRTDEEIYPPDMAAACRASDAVVLTSNDVCSFEETTESRGAERTFFTNKGPLRDGNGQLAGTFGISRDITERKRGEEALRLNEERVRLLLEHTAEGVYGVDREGRCTFLNRAAATMLGYGPDELLGKHLHPLIHHTRADGTPYPLEQCPISGVVGTGRPCRVRAELLWRRDGTSFFADYSAAPVGEGGCHGAVIGFTDSTEQRRVEVALRESEERYRGLFENHLTGDFIAAPDGRLLACNPAFARIFGFESVAGALATDVAALYPDPAILDQLTRLVPYDSASVMLFEGGRLAVHAMRGYERFVIPGATRHLVFDPASYPIFDAILKSGEPVVVRDTVVEPGWQRAAGAEHVRSWLGVPLVQQGRTIGLFSMDRTEPDFFTVERVRPAQALAPVAAAAIGRARLLGELREKQARLELALAASGLGPWDWDLRTNAVYFSPEWKRQLGHEEHEIPGRHEEWESRLHPEDREPTLAAMRTYLDGRRPQDHVEFRLRHKDGSYRWIHTRGEVLRGADGKPERMLGCHLDITARKRGEEQLRESEAAYRTLFEHAPDGLFLVDPGGRFVDVNAAGTRLFGYTREELCGLHISDLTVQAEEKYVGQALVEVKEGHTHQREWQCKRRDGSVFGAEITGTLMPGGNLLGILRDVTERKHLQEELRLKSQSLQALSQRLLETQEAERRHLARELHDEIGQVMTAVAINLRGLAAEAGGSARIQECLEMVEIATQQVRALSLELRPAVLDDLGLEAAIRWQADRQGHAAGHCLFFSGGLDGRRHHMDVEVACFRIAQEALNNLTKHARARNVWVSLDRCEEGVHLSVRDDGIGFDAAAARQRVASGASFGLLGMEERAKLLGGRFRIASGPGAGTTVEAWIPEAPPGAHGGASAKP